MRMGQPVRLRLIRGRVLTLTVRDPNGRILRLSDAPRVFVAGNGRSARARPVQIQNGRDRSYVYTITAPIGEDIRLIVDSELYLRTSDGAIVRPRVPALQWAPSPSNVDQTLSIYY